MARTITSTHNPARAKLAEKIANASALDRELEAGKAAVSKAEERKFTALEALERLQAANARGAAEQDMGAVFIAALAAGGDCAVDVLDRPKVSAKEEELQREVEVWRDTEKRCAAIVPDLEERLSWAQRRVEDAARDVVRAAGAVGPLLAGLAELEAEIISRRLALNFLARNKFVSESDDEAVKRALRNTALPGDASAAYFPQWLGHPVTQAWGHAYGALMRDADAPLPTCEAMK